MNRGCFSRKDSRPCDSPELAARHLLSSERPGARPSQNALGLQESEACARQGNGRVLESNGVPEKLTSISRYAGVFLAFLVTRALCGETQTPPQPESPHTEGTETLHSRWNLGRARLSTNGFDYSLSYTGEVLVNAAGGIQQGAAYEGLLKAQLDFNTTRMHLWDGGQLHISALYPHGQSPSRTLLGDIFTLSNIDAPDQPRLFELWYQHEILQQRVSLRVGQLSADEEFAGTESGCLFINGTCGWPAIIALNAPSPAYPVGAPGVRLALTPNEHWRFQTAAYSGNPYPLNDAEQPIDPNGTRFNLEGGVISISEIAAKWNNTGEAIGLPGQAKLGAWYHTSFFNDARRDSDGYFLADPRSSGIPGRLSGNWGSYLTGEQLVYRERDSAAADQGLTAFCRFGGTPEDRNLVSFYLEGGLNYRGLFPERDQDEIGVAVVHGRISDDVRGAASDRNEVTGCRDALPDYEMITEAEYRFVWRDGLTVQPGFHWLSHPNGSAQLEDALIFSLRVFIEF